MFYDFVVRNYILLQNEYDDVTLRTRFAFLSACITFTG